MGVKYDFSGWATKNDIRCSDGRTIRAGAFKANDGQKVPLVWSHQHNSPDNVLGYAVLENRPEGVYAYGSFNGTPMGQHAKELVEHGDIDALSIHANQLRQNGGDVVHGNIREVSLVIAGANPGAVIMNPIIEHADGFSEVEEEATIFTGLPLNPRAGERYEENEMANNKSLSHADKEKTVADVFKTFTDKEKKVLAYMIAMAIDGGSDEGANEGEVSHAESDNSSDGETIQDVIDAMDEEKKKVFYFLLQKGIEDAQAGDDEDDDEEVEHSDYEGENAMSMNYNVFEGNDYDEETLSHDAMTAIIEDGKRFGSLKDSFLQHAEEYGIENIDFLFPDYHDLDTPPTFIKRDTGWVSKVMGSVHHSPFSRIKSRHANITEDEARARGYMKGKLKKEEMFSLLKRATDPQTIYKKQKMDRDDVIDITDFDVVAWIKAEMRMMLDEEIARAILIGDGRLASDDDKIHEDHVRPVVKDADLYNIKISVTAATGTFDNDMAALAKPFIKAAIRARKDYRGSGSPTLYCQEDLLCEMLLLEDNDGHTLYKSEAELATVLRVKEIVTVPVMEDQLGVIVNLADYNVGADKGGAIDMFEDFDIDYNQMKYLIETRISGALTVPYSAMTFTKAS